MKIVASIALAAIMLPGDLSAIQNKRLLIPSAKRTFYSSFLFRSNIVSHSKYFFTSSRAYSSYKNYLKTKNYLKANDDTLSQNKNLIFSAISRQPAKLRTYVTFRNKNEKRIQYNYDIKRKRYFCVEPLNATEINKSWFSTTISQPSSSRTLEELEKSLQTAQTLKEEYMILTKAQKDGILKFDSNEREILNPQTASLKHIITCTEKHCITTLGTAERDLEGPLKELLEATKIILARKNSTDQNDIYVLRRNRSFIEDLEQTDHAVIAGLTRLTARNIKNTSKDNEINAGNIMVSKYNIRVLRAAYIKELYID